MFQYIRVFVDFLMTMFCTSHDVSECRAESKLLNRIRIRNSACYVSICESIYHIQYIHKYTN